MAAGQRTARANLQAMPFSELLDQFAQLHVTKAQSEPFTTAWWDTADCIEQLRAELHRRTN